MGQLLVTGILVQMDSSIFINQKLITSMLNGSIGISSTPPRETSAGSLRFNTRALFSDYRKAFYGTAWKGKKHLPECFEKNLNPTLLAVWYMDDGGKLTSVAPGHGAVLHIMSFTEEEGF